MFTKQQLSNRSCGVARSFVCSRCLTRNSSLIHQLPAISKLVGVVLVTLVTDHVHRVWSCKSIDAQYYYHCSLNSFINFLLDQFRPFLLPVTVVVMSREYPKFNPNNNLSLGNFPLQLGLGGPGSRKLKIRQFHVPNDHSVIARSKR